ncbi:MAG: hypothetical protein GZ094_12750 [Mariniphaga sp.]|nr:hypothetical protein [Mariniphaga sp.]
MASTEQIRNNLIDKLLSINNRDIIVSLDKLLESTIREKDIYKVSKQQNLILAASETDIKNGDLISDEEVNREEDLWLNK